MLVFGGFKNKQGVAYSLDLTSMNWSSINNVQYKRYGHSADLIGNSIYLFGGLQSNANSWFENEKNDIHKYDLDNKNLQRVKTTG